MQNHSTTTLKKCDPFTTGNANLDDLLQVYWSQLHAMADAEMAGLPEPYFDVPPLPDDLVTVD